MKTLIFSLAMTGAFLAAPHAEAAFVVNIVQSGANVVATGVGSINTSGLTNTGTSSNSGVVWPDHSLLSVGAPASVIYYTGAAGMSGFGAGPRILASSSSGDTVGMVIANTGYGIYTPTNYVSGASLSGSATWNGQTLAGLGLNVGTYIYTWGTGASADSFVINIGTQSTSIIPQIADGGFWRTAIMVVNVSSIPGTVSLNFFQDTLAGSTSPWLPAFVEMSTTQNILVPPSGVTFIHTLGLPSTLTQGWAQVNGSSSGLTAYAIYTYSTGGGRPDQDGTSPAVPVASSAKVPFDNTTGYATGVAVVNPGSAAETVTVTVQTDAGAVSQTSFQLPAFGQVAIVTATSYPQTVGHRGMLQFTGSAGAISASAFRFNPTLALTSSPVFLTTF